jgi:hypothetical protein
VGPGGGDVLYYCREGAFSDKCFVPRGSPALRAIPILRFFSPDRRSLFHQFLPATENVPMLNIDLSPPEQAILRDVLQNAVSELGTEISGTDAKDYRDSLKARREVLQKLIAALGGEPVS